MNPQMNVIGFAIELIQSCFKIVTNLSKGRLQSLQGIRVKDFAAILWNKDQVDMNPVNHMPAMPKLILHLFRPIRIVRE